MLPKAPKDFAAVERSIIENGLVADEDKSSQKLYLARLKKCLSCSRLTDITCMECGSYVQVRAMDKNKSCPHPDKSLW
jgi:hypothetical protein